MNNKHFYFMKWMTNNINNCYNINDAIIAYTLLIKKSFSHIIFQSFAYS